MAMLEDRTKAPISQASSDSICGPAFAKADIWMLYLEDRSETEVALLFPLASQDTEALVFLWQCSGGPRVWYLFLRVPGTSILMAWICSEAVCLEPGAEAAISLLLSFLVIPQFSDHCSGWHVWDYSWKLISTLSNHFVNTEFFMLNPFEFKWARMASFIFNQIHANTDEAHHCSQPLASLLLFPTSLYCQTAVILGASENSGMTHCYSSCYYFSSMCFSFQNWSLACSEWSCFWWTAVCPA